MYSGVFFQLTLKQFCGPFQFSAIQNNKLSCVYFTKNQFDRTRERHNNNNKCNQKKKQKKRNQNFVFQYELSLSQSIGVNFDDLKGEMKSAWKNEWIQ